MLHVLVHVRVHTCSWIGICIHRYNLIWIDNTSFDRLVQDTGYSPKQPRDNYKAMSEMRTPPLIRTTSTVPTSL